MIAAFLGLTGVALLIAGPLMIMQGLAGRRNVTRELRRQRISFPAEESLPVTLVRYAGLPVHTGVQARAFSEVIAIHVDKATGGRSYAQIFDEWLASGRTDERLTRLRETAFMGQSLRGALLSAYQAWQVSLLVIGLGTLFTARRRGFPGPGTHHLVTPRESNAAAPSAQSPPAELRRKRGTEALSCGAGAPVDFRLSSPVVSSPSLTLQHHGSGERRRPTSPGAGDRTGCRVRFPRS